MCVSECLRLSIYLWGSISVYLSLSLCVYVCLYASVCVCVWCVSVSVSLYLWYMGGVHSLCRSIWTRLVSECSSGLLIFNILLLFYFSLSCVTFFFRESSFNWQWFVIWEWSKQKKLGTCQPEGSCLDGLQDSSRKEELILLFPATASRHGRASVHSIACRGSKHGVCIVTCKC